MQCSLKFCFREKGFELIGEVAFAASSHAGTNEQQVDQLNESHANALGGECKLPEMQI